MVCRSCGNEIKPGEQFCSKCGAKFTEEDESVAKKVNRKLVVIVVAIIVVLGVVCGILYERAHTINFNDYLQVTYEGYDGVGTAQLDMDVDGIVDAFQEKTKKGHINEMELLFYLEDKMEAGLDKETNLSNGDEVKLTEKVNQDAIKKKYGIKVKYQKEKTYKVEGLEKTKNFDAFKDIEIEYSGSAPKGTMEIHNKKYDELSYEVENNGSLSNGDKVKVTVKAYNDEDFSNFCKKNGCIPKKAEKKMTVDGLKTLVTDVAQLDDNILAPLKKDAEDIFTAEIASDYDSSITLGTLNYLGTYVLVSKEEDSWYDNMLVLVYEETVNCGSATYTSYVYCNAHDVRVDEKGNIEYSDVYNGGGYYDVGEYYIPGYQDMDSLVNEAVISEIDEYTYTTTMQ